MEASDGTTGVTDMVATVAMLDTGMDGIAGTDGIDSVGITGAMEVTDLEMHGAHLTVTAMLIKVITVIEVTLTTQVDAYLVIETHLQETMLE